MEKDPRARSAWMYSIEGLRLVWETSRSLTVILVITTVVSGLAPAGAAFVARYVVDGVLDTVRGNASAHAGTLIAIGIEGMLVTLVLASGRAVTFCQALLKAKLAHHVNLRILRKAITLQLSDFEDPALNDRMEEARREATVRPLSLALRAVSLARYALSLIGYAIVLTDLSRWAVAIVLVAGIPSFVAEARFSHEAFRFFQRHSPESRERHYLETLLTREETAKEIGFFGLGKLLVGRYDAMFAHLYDADRRIAMKRHLWGLGLGLVGNLAFFGAYIWIVEKAMVGRITLGEMTMYLVVFRQAQQAVSSALTSLGGVYEDALYLENLDLFLAHPVPEVKAGRLAGPDPRDGLRVENVSFVYEGTDRPALEDVSFHVPPGHTLAIVGHNGSGKSTLVKLLTRRYLPVHGRILLDGLALGEWDEDALRQRISVLYQDFNRYKLSLGENIGAGDPPRFDDEPGWRRAADEGLAAEMIDELPKGFHTKMGKAHKGGAELSGGQWQRLAFARALMPVDTELLVFDEPTSAADPKRQAEIDERLAEILHGRMGVIVSHRLATARIADEIVVLDHGKVRERGTHDELLGQAGLYAELFETQANAYR